MLRNPFFAFYYYASQNGLIPLAGGGA